MYIHSYDQYEAVVHNLVTPSVNVMACIGKPCVKAGDSYRLGRNTVSVDFASEVWDGKQVIGLHAAHLWSIMTWDLNKDQNAYDQNQLRGNYTEACVAFADECERLFQMPYSQIAGFYAEQMDQWARRSRSERLVFDHEYQDDALGQDCPWGM